MEVIYDLQRHTHFVVICIQNGGSSTGFYHNLNRSHFASNEQPDIESHIVYRNHINSINTYKAYRENGIPVNSFMDGLYQIFKKGEDKWDKKDRFLMKTVSDFISSQVKKDGGALDTFHYAFIIPSEWEENIKEEIIRPIFIQAGLISSEDHPDRLLFFTDVESAGYALQNNDNTKSLFKRGQNMVFCKFFCFKDGEVSIKLDLVQTINNCFDFPDSMLFPNIVKSILLSFSADDIKNSLKQFLVEKLFPAQEDVIQEQKSIKEYLKSKLIPIYHDQIAIKDMAENIYRGDLPDMNTYDKDGTQEHWISTKKRWFLNENQETAIKSIRPIDVYARVSKSFLEALQNLLSNNVTKEYLLFLMDNKCFGYTYLDDCYLKWFDCVLEYSRRYFKRFTVTRVDMSINMGEIQRGACHRVFEAVKNSNTNSKPRILNDSILDASSSKFPSFKPNIFINIDISLKYTSLSLSLLNTDGLTEKIFDHDYFTSDKCLPALESFYRVSHITTLTVKEAFISFADDYLMADTNRISNDKDDLARNEQNMLNIDEILRNEYPADETLVSTEQKKYIEAFLLMYISHIKEIISSKLPSDLTSGSTNIAYAISIEKFLLDAVVKSIKDFKEIIHASGLVQKEDNSKKLRIITHGEGMLPAIRKFLDVKLPLKSYFVLAQLHENYIQLTLNQAVTCPNLKEEQESIIIKDKIVPIKNIYDSLCLNVWNNIQENNDLIHLCDKHNTNDTDGMLELLTTKIEKEFRINLKRYISKNILTESTDSQCINRISSIKLSASCSCDFRSSIFDIMNVSFKPVLQDIMRYVSSSLTKKELFGNYDGVNYLFSSVCFSNNPQLQHWFKLVLQRESDNFNLEQGIETHSLIIPTLSNLILPPVLKQQPYGYQSFQMGSFCQVSSENYAVVIHHSNLLADRTFRNKRDDTEEFLFSQYNVFPLLKKGDIISNNRVERIFYFKQNCDTNWCISIRLFRYKTLDDLSYNGNATAPKGTGQLVNGTDKFFKYSDFQSDEYVPLTIGVRSQNHSSSLQFSLGVVGQGINEMKISETGEPLTLSRF